jgi:hypothetical protein
MTETGTTGTTGTALDASRRLRVPLLRLGGDFMVSPEMKAESLGHGRAAMYFRGRVGVLGEVTVDTALGLLAIFPADLIHAVWARTAELTAATAAERYGAAASAWGRTHLAGRPGLIETAERMLAVVDADWTGTLPLVDAWRRAPRPSAPAELAVHAAMLLRELRGGLHFAALNVHGLPVPMGMLADPLGGEAFLRATGWSQEQIAELVDEYRPEHAERWQAAEDDTNRAFADRLRAALGDGGATVLAEQVERLRS